MNLKAFKDEVTKLKKNSTDISKIGNENDTKDYGNLLAGIYTWLKTEGNDNVILSNIQTDGKTTSIIIGGLNKEKLQQYLVFYYKKDYGANWVAAENKLVMSIKPQSGGSNVVTTTTTENDEIANMVYGKAANAAVTLSQLSETINRIKKLF